MKKEPLGLIDRLAVGVTVLALGVVIWLSIGPKGLVIQWWTNMRQVRKDREAVTTLLPTLYSLSGSGAAGSSAISQNVVFEFFDYQCPFCLMSEDSIRILNADPRLEFRLIHYPLPFHREARRAATAAMCAYTFDRGVEMHKYLVSTTSWYTDSTMSGAAKAVGIDFQKFTECMTSKVTAARIDSSIAMAAKLHVPATPTFISAKGRHQGVYNSAAAGELR